MMTRARSPFRSAPCRSASLRSRAKLGGYLAAGVGASVLGTAHTEAAVVGINLGGYPGASSVNGGATSGTYRQFYDFPVTGPSIAAYNNFLLNFPSGNATGLDGDYGLVLAITGGNASIRKFGLGATIDSSATFSGKTEETVFKFNSTTASDFGANSFVGFRYGSSPNYYYGCLEVTWNSATSHFQILSGAYETTVNTPIIAQVAPVPEPSTIALTGLGALALGGGAIRRSRKARKESLVTAV